MAGLLCTVGSCSPAAVHCRLATYCCAVPGPWYMARAQLQARSPGLAPRFCRQAWHKEHVALPLPNGGDTARSAMLAWGEGSVPQGSHGWVNVAVAVHIIRCRACGQVQLVLSQSDCPRGMHAVTPHKVVGGVCALVGLGPTPWLLVVGRRSCHPMVMPASAGILGRSWCTVIMPHTHHVASVVGALGTTRMHALAMNSAAGVPLVQCSTMCFTAWAGLAERVQGCSSIVCCHRHGGGGGAVVEGVHAAMCSPSGRGAVKCHGVGLQWLSCACIAYSLPVVSDMQP
jgi:hypothetical protein